MAVCTGLLKTAPPLMQISTGVATAPLKFQGADILEVPPADTIGEEMKTKIPFPAWEEILL